MTKSAQHNKDLDDEDLTFSVPENPMSPGGEVKSKGSSTAAATTGLPEGNESLPALIGSSVPVNVDARNGIKEHGNSTGSGSAVEKLTVVDVNAPNFSKEEAIKLHSVYEKSDDFDHPKVGPPQGKIPRNSFYYDAIVVGVVSPSNFYMRSYRHSKALEIMEKQMMDWYDKNYSATSFGMDNLILYGFYVLRKDGKYIRVKIVPPFTPTGDKVMVELLDHGGFIQVEPSQLVALHRNYLYLPTQAWKAKLQVPSWPSITKWSPEDCSRFKENVEGKSLVALILGESIDDFTNERCLGCVLVDTSGSKDLYIHMQLNVNKTK